MSYLDDYLNDFDNEFDDDDFDDYEDEQDFYAYDYPFHPDLAQRDRDRRDRDRHDRDHDDRRRRRVRCCVYRHRRSGRIRKVCQSRDRRCANRLGREWTLIDSFSARNCNRCL
ncbi:hypothetical protein [Shimazuella alba]|uniref:Uncharacterized protein n=1 Tax=Shimazuella alba TaxID=2690964 RepID=A0A6I4VN88_9BACL|nr:hypothetical protein [Shimazuella alba]MXQ52977.1 hypothetical protein [Shimazuella alba]